MLEGYKKYIPFKPINLPDRTWPDKVITKAPIWCSVDMRDGNQSLVDPMNLQEKLELFQTLVNIGVKEIEVGFPSASETEYEILRTLIEGNYIPDDVTIQVLVQAREHLIKKTFEAIKGAKKRYRAFLQFNFNAAAQGCFQNRYAGSYRYRRKRRKAYQAAYGRGIKAQSGYEYQI